MQAPLHRMGSRPLAQSQTCQRQVPAPALALQITWQALRQVPQHQRDFQSAARTGSVPQKERRRLKKGWLVAPMAPQNRTSHQPAQQTGYSLAPVRARKGSQLQEHQRGCFRRTFGVQKDSEVAPACTALKLLGSMFARISEFLLIRRQKSQIVTFL